LFLRSPGSKDWMLLSNEMISLFEAAELRSCWLVAESVTMPQGVVLLVLPGLIA